jgi:hypothetical protein
VTEALMDAFFSFSVKIPFVIFVICSFVCLSLATLWRKVYRAATICLRDWWHSTSFFSDSLNLPNVDSAYYSSFWLSRNTLSRLYFYNLFYFLFAFMFSYSNLRTALSDFISFKLNAISAAFSNA